MLSYLVTNSISSSITLTTYRFDGSNPNKVKTFLLSFLNKEEFKNIPASLSIANDGNLVISESKEAMSTEVDSMLSISKQILESVDYHQEVIKKCEQILKDLNPQFAKDKLQEEKINSLEERIGGVENTLGDIKDMLSKALNNK